MSKPRNYVFAGAFAVLTASAALIGNGLSQEMPDLSEHATPSTVISVSKPAPVCVQQYAQVGFSAAPKPDECPEGYVSRPQQMWPMPHYDKHQFDAVPQRV